MESKLRDLLDKIYELEGLVHLALKRDDSSKDFLRLISKKGKEIGEISQSFSSQSLDGESNTELLQSNLSDPSFSLAEYTIDEEQEDFSLNANNGISLSGLNKADTTDKNRGKLVFSINDRFRFRRELFENSDVDFNNTLALVASMDDYDEAEDYFISEVGFDKSNPVVGEFFDVIKKYFQ